MQKIMFNDKYGLTKAVLQGIKTHTRRIVKCPKTFAGKHVSGFRILTNSLGQQLTYLVDEDEREIEGSYLRPAYEIGEEVAVAQSYKDAGLDPHFLISPVDDGVEIMDVPGWNNKMFTKAELMPHRIKITNRRIERLQDICEEDCLKEGVKRKKERYVVENQKGVVFYTNDPILAFRCLIDKTCGKGTWESNPWVFVYDFEIVE